MNNKENKKKGKKILNIGIMYLKKYSKINYLGTRWIRKKVNCIVKIQIEKLWRKSFALKKKSLKFINKLNGWE